jgi:hypothetical protein
MTTAALPVDGWLWARPVPVHHDAPTYNRDAGRYEYEGPAPEVDPLDWGDAR